MCVCELFVNNFNINTQFKSNPVKLKIMDPYGCIFKIG